MSEFERDLVRRADGWCRRRPGRSRHSGGGQGGAGGLIERLLVFDVGIVEADDDERAAADETGARRERRRGRCGIDGCGGKGALVIVRRSSTAAPSASAWRARCRGNGSGCEIPRSPLSSRSSETEVWVGASSSMPQLAMVLLDRAIGRSSGSRIDCQQVRGEGRVLGDVVGEPVHLVEIGADDAAAAPARRQASITPGLPRAGADLELGIDGADRDLVGWRRWHPCRRAIGWRAGPARRSPAAAGPGPSGIG